MIGWKSNEGEPSLDELLADEIMVPVMRSAGMDCAALKGALAETARRRDSRRRRVDPRVAA